VSNGAEEEVLDVLLAVMDLIAQDRSLEKGRKQYHGSGPSEWACLPLMTGFIWTSGREPLDFNDGLSSLELRISGQHDRPFAPG
jgi:hypothetical protein